MPHRRLYAQATVRVARPATRRSAHAVDPAALGRLRRRFAGEIATPDEPGYAALRAGFNPRYDPHPALVLRPRGEAALRTGLAFLRARGLPFAVRGGGHSFSGSSGSEGAVLDMGHFDAIAIEGRRVTVGAGCRQGVLGAALRRAGLHVPLGDSPGVAVGGFMQGGGYGHTARLFGMNCDHAAALRVMLADGRVVTADAARNADLFWAMRGGVGGGLGILLDIAYAARPRPRLSVDTLVWPLHSPAGRDRAADALACIQADHTGAAAPGTALHGMIARGQTRAHRGPWLIVDAVHRGGAAGRDAALARLRGIGGLSEGFQDGWLRRVSRMPAMSRQSRYVGRTLAPADWRGILDLMHAGPDPLSTMYVLAHGDGIDATPREACAFIHRTPSLLLTHDAFWQRPQDEATALAGQRDWAGLVAPFWNGRCYQNFPNADLADYRTAYWGEAFPALCAVRAKYDPVRALAGPQDITPAAPLPPPLWPPTVADALARPIEVAA